MFSDFDFHDIRDQSDENINNEELYNVLNVDKNATDAQIKKAYYLLARKNHPDKGGDEAKFKKIQFAFEVLKDKKKRSIYDRYGEAGLKGEFGGASSASSIFDLFTGRTRRGPRVGKDIQYQLPVTLKDVYKGTTKKLKIVKNEFCGKCKGIGTKSGKKTACAACNGSGVRIRMQQMGRGIISQIQSPCSDCGATGEKIDKNDACDDCNGRRIVKNKKVLQVVIEPGSLSGQKICFEGEADASPGVQPGNLIVLLLVKSEPGFKRKGLNIYYKKQITLTEALCGAEFFITQLDGRKLYVNTKGTVVSPGEVRVIAEEGMPQKNNPFIKGVMFVEFSIDFPSEKAILNKNLDDLKKILGQQVNILSSKEKSTQVKLERKKVEDVLESQKALERNSEDEDEEEEGFSGGTTCQQQ